MTLYNIGISDGAWRRGLLGTLLQPIWSLTGYRYGVMALVALTFLGLLILVGLLVVVRARWDAQRLLIIVWFLSPAGGYLFHEIGYTDQVVYLLFFVAAWAMARSHFVIAIALVTFSVFLHELTLFTTVPLLLVLALVRGEPARRLVAFSFPALVGLVLARAPMMTPDQVGATGARLQEQLPFEIRMDAVALFGRSLTQTWDMDFYSPLRGFVTVLPLMIVAVGSISVVLARADNKGFSVPRPVAWLVVVGAVIAPFSLVFFGWDFYRWMFLGMVNFLILTVILWSSLTERPTLVVFGVALAPILMLFYVQLNYFDGYSPRPFSIGMFEKIGYSPHTEFLGFPDDRL